MGQEASSKAEGASLLSHPAQGRQVPDLGEGKLLERESHVGCRACQAREDTSQHPVYLFTRRLGLEHV